MLTIADAVVTARPCACRCHETLAAADRARGIDALYTCDDALRGWGYAPIYELHGDALWRAAQAKADPSYRGVAVRFGECIHRRLLGSMLHEILHASFGDPARANHGIPYGLPYGVPAEVPAAEEEAFLSPFNFAEARAFVGVWILGRAMFAIDWELRTARDVGTYGFAGGNALVPVPAGFRAVAHVDRQHHAGRYYARAHRLEEEARAWFTAAHVEGLIEGVKTAAARGRATRPKRYPDPAEVARIAPRKIGRNEPCTCGSAEKWKACCGATGAAGPNAARAPSMAR